jgi:predicted nucleic acid-binding protein
VTQQDEAGAPEPGGASLRAVLDTNLVIAADVPTMEGELAISAVTIAELHFGVLIARDQAVRAERLRRLSVLQRAFDPLPVDDAVAASYGQLAAAVVAAGRQPRARTMDLLIAATAHAHGARLYTRNADDFRGLDGLVDVVTV